MIWYFPLTPTTAAGASLKTWRVLRKEVRRIDADSSQLVLYVADKSGREREAVVSGRTYDTVKDGDDVELSLE
jgi:hypothetical protein